MNTSTCATTDPRQYSRMCRKRRRAKQLQRRRIQKRNTPEFQERFFSAWIPMERRYFDAFGIPAVCDLTLEVTE